MKDRLNHLTRTDFILGLLLALIALCVYLATLTPSLSYLSPDGNELATIPYVLGLAHMPGYPFYTWLGKAFTWLPFGDVAHRMNLMSAVLGSIGVAGLYLLITILLHRRTASDTVRRAGASLAALTFAFSPTFWSQAVITEVYAPNIAMLALTLLLLFRWECTRRDRDFFLFALAFGLSLGTHISNIGFAPAIALYVLLTDRSVLKRPTWWLAALSGFGLGLAQFAWLPYHADMLNDRTMLRQAPTTLKGIYDYTLGAFPQLKFAFSLGQLPDRVVVYIYLLWRQFGFLAILLGVIGLFAMLIRRTRHYFLLMVMYLVHTWFFIQYRAFDLEVFFLPAHFLWAIFIAFGLIESMHAIERRMAKMTSDRVATTGRWALAVVTIAFALIPLTENFASNDHSDDVSSNDFYANVWEFLPENSTLLTQGGVMGYDAFYWQLVYDTRPDVILPALPTPNPSSADLRDGVLFSSTPLIGANLARGPGALPKGLIPQEAWQTPVLIGTQGEAGITSPRNRLILYQLSTKAPTLVVDDAEPEIAINADLGNLSLLGADISHGPVESGGCIHLTLYWTLEQAQRVGVTTVLGAQPLETHDLGFGNLQRYQAEVGSVLGNVIIEDYWLVIPSTTPVGAHPLTLQILGSDHTIEIASVEVENEEETMERWLRIAD